VTSPVARDGIAGRVETATVAVAVAAALCTAVVVRRQMPWIPTPYLAALVATPVTGWWIARRAKWRRRWRWPLAGVAGLTFVALLPVPTMRMPLDHPPGTAWRLDGRLAIDGVIVDPAGAWYWLTVGRPPIVAELVRAWWPTDDEAAPESLVGGPRAHRPAFAEPAAAAIGLRRAGWPLAIEVNVELSGPADAELPARAVVVTVNGRDVRTRASWEEATRALGDRNTFVDGDGRRHEFAGREWPYRRVDVIDAPRDDLNVVVGGWLARTAPGRWVRQLALGPSHALMVALVSYVYGSGDDLGEGRSIAGTGKIRGDGGVGSISGLWAKATAARDVGAQVLLFPTAQREALDGFEPGAMQLCPIATLDEAIDALSATGRCAR
jgi:PDZ domain-containing protein